VQAMQPSVTSYVVPQVAGQPVTYSSAPVPYTGVAHYSASLPAAYSAAPIVIDQGMTGVTQAPLVYPQPGEYGTAYAQPVSYGGGMQAGFGGLPPAPSMVAYPGAVIQAPVAPVYAPMSVQQAWDNHFAAFGAQDIDKMMLDYDDTSIVKLWNNTTQTQTEFRGMAAIREMFLNIWQEMTDISTLQAPVQDVEEEMLTVFLVWKCPSSGFKHATDTFLFGNDFKIKRQNIVVTKETLGSGVSGSPTKVSKKSAKKKKGLC